MTQLDRGGCAELTQEIGDAAVTPHMLVVIDAGAIVSAPPDGLDRRLLREHDASAADSELPEMDEMPVGGVAVEREILRHRPEHDAVAQRDAAHRQRTKQQRALLDRRPEARVCDLDLDAAKKQAAAIGPNALAVACDVTKDVSVAFGQVIKAFGGVDIVVSNAGAAWQGRIGEVSDEILRKSFELNFFAHQRVAQAATRIMLAQGSGGCLLFNVSKQAVNPGPNFGPYGLPKAATLFLVRQYALDYGSDGIRANAVNADRIRSGLLTDDFIKERSKARGVTEKDYMSGNLLGREVTADDVAQAFLHQALELKTTGDVTTVDGGNIAAALR